MGLQDELNALKAQSMKRIPKPTADIMANAMEELHHANILDHSKRKGDVAPDFELPDAQGKIISLKTLLFINYIKRPVF